MSKFKVKTINVTTIGLIVAISFLAGCYEINDGFGNSQSNIKNGGYIAKKGSFLYYRNINDKGKLYKSKIDGSNPQKLSDDENVAFINVFNDWIFYVNNTNNKGNIVKIKNDGTQRKEMNDSRTRQLLFNRGVLVYINLDDLKLNIIRVVNNQETFRSFSGHRVYDFTIDPRGMGTLFYIAEDESLRWTNVFETLPGELNGKKFMDGFYLSLLYNNKRLFYAKLHHSRHSFSFESRDAIPFFSNTVKYKGLEFLDDLEYGVTDSHIIFFYEPDKTVYKMKINGKRLEEIAKIDEVNTNFGTVIQIIDKTIYFYFYNRHENMELKTFKFAKNMTKNEKHQQPPDDLTI